MTSKLAVKLMADFLGREHLHATQYDANLVLIDQIIERLRKVIEAAVEHDDKNASCLICREFIGRDHDRHNNDCPVPAALELLEEYDE